MANFLLVSRSISFIVISVGGIFLSIVLAFLFVSYNPTGTRLSINGYFIGMGNSSQPSLDSINGVQTEFSNKLPEISEQGHEMVEDEQFSFGAEVPDSNSSHSVNDIKGANISASSEFTDDSEKNGYETGGYIGVQMPAFAPELSVDAGTSIGQGNISISSVSVNGSAKNDSGIVNYIGAEVPAIAPTLSLDAEVPAIAPTLSLDANGHVSVNVRDSKEPDVSISSALGNDSGKNDSGIGSSTVDSLHQTGSVAALPPPPSKAFTKTALRHCDLYHGKWVYDPTGPLYTNITCPFIAQPQNCQGNGRPDKDYENWRWRPNKCKIPRFDGRKFLELMRGKTLAFVGDSLARNQMESLLCILWQTEVPINHGNRQMHKWHFRSTSTTIIRIWSAWLVHKTPLPIPFSSPRSVNVHLNTPDKSFINFLPDFNVLILSSGHWFSTETTYLLNNTIKKTRKKKDVIGFYDIALQTTLSSLLEFSNYTGLIILRSYSPEHYLGGRWNSGGGCSGIYKPARKSIRSGYTNSMEKVQVVEFEKAAKNLRNGLRLRFMDVTEMSGYRSDGHAGKHSRKVRMKNAAEDCVHWCMPGIVDTWNEVLFEMLKREF